MATAGSTGGTLPPNFLLTPQQQSLLFAALNSNNQQNPSNSASLIQTKKNNNSDSAKNGSVSLNSFKASPAQNMETSPSVQESPYLDNLDYDFGDSSFDFSFASNDATVMNDETADGMKSDSSEGDGSPEKRSHPDDEDDEDSPENGAKRREGSDKAPKKPGRKPLTNEPSSKRKAQNRAAQRAFRERKEKHLKDLETKVDELEKASEAANHENDKLKQQVERMTAELAQYKQKLTLVASNKPSRDKVSTFGSAAVSSLNDINFQFDFPKFGVMPGPDKQSSFPSPPTTTTNAPITGFPTPPSTTIATDKVNPQGQKSRDAQFREELAKFNGLYTPSMASSTANGSRASLDSGNFSVGAATSSPSVSSNSNVGGPSSSCGTSPEPLTQSPLGFKPMDTLGTIGEENPTMSVSDQPFSQFANYDISNNNFDWLAQQNGGQFDPQLFGGYREPQENITNNPSFDDFFNDAIDNDFFTPYNAGPGSPNAIKKPQNSLVEQIDAQKESPEEFPAKSNLHCNEIWEKLQSCPNAQSGEFDLDGLCSELTKKAKCSGTGPVVQETDFDTLLKKYMGKDVSTASVANSLGISVKKDAPTNGLSL